MSAPSHSKFSASAAPRWINCPGSVVLSEGKPNNGNIYSATGTVEHEMLEAAIKDGMVPGGFLGATFKVDGFDIVVDDDMVDRVQWAVDKVGEITAGADTVTSEQRVNYAHWLGVETDQAWGTRDVGAIFIAQRELMVVDYKGGSTPVAADSEQLKLYAGGDLLTCDELDIEIATVRLVILQPKVSRSPIEHVIDAADLRQWLETHARDAAFRVQDAAENGQGRRWAEIYLQPGDKQCRFCPAKATCPALRAEVASTVFDSTAASPDEFGVAEVVDPECASDQAWLAAAMSKADLIEDWLKAVRAEVERRLLAGTEVPGYKLVQGKQGNRAWADKAAAEKLLRETFRLPIEKAFNLSLISPTDAEKLAKAGDIGPRQWPKANTLITRAPGKAHVAPATDPRPALDIRPVADEFTDASTNDIC